MTLKCMQCGGNYRPGPSTHEPYCTADCAMWGIEAPWRRRHTTDPKFYYPIAKPTKEKEVNND